ncbi:unnamed protein product [Rangifer tarandus platyrhynchus]|uniref:Uncharacterized protein n=1 Tax=Rangifer tarandus platyrhynchus TaxID=3082113 RepID=A0AC59ZLZ6_RANTA
MQKLLSAALASGVGGSVLPPWGYRREWDQDLLSRSSSAPREGVLLPFSLVHTPSQQPLPNPGCFSRFSSNSDSSLNPSLALSLRCSSSETSEQLLSIHFSSQSCTVA